MPDGMGDMSGMIWGMGIGHLLLVVVAVLAIAAHMVSGDGVQPSSGQSDL